MLAENVVKFENENMKAFNFIQDYFKSLNRRNRDFEDVKDTKTAKDYEGDLRLYYRLMKGKEKGKELEFLNMNDLAITQDDFEEYIEVLCDLKNESGKNLYVNKTVNRKLSSLKSFVKFLKRKKIIDIDISYLELIKGEKEKKNHYGVLSADEVIQMADLAYHERNKGEVKYFMIHLTFKTGLRISELLNLKWSDFIIGSNDVEINGIGKGNKEFQMYITKPFYQDLVDNLYHEGKEYVFDISEKTVNRMMDTLRKKMNISPERQIVFHSIRKAYGTVIYNKHKDINAARIALRHASILTTQIYLGIDDYKIHKTIFDVEEIDEHLFVKVDHNTLVEALLECNKDVQLLVNLKISELQKKK